MGNGRGAGRRRARAASGVVLAAALLLVGCGGGDEPAPTPTAVPVTPTAPSAEPISLGPIVWTTAVDPATGAPEEDLKVIPHDAPAIIAAIETGPLPAGTVLTGTWTMNGVDVPGGPVTVRAENARGAGWVTFTLTRDEGATWPPGILELTVTGNGERVTGSVRIQVN